MYSSRWLKTFMLATLLGLASANLMAADRDHDGPGRDRRAPERGWVFDGRYNHNRYYPPPGFVMHARPRNYVSVRFGGAPYFFSEGIWYRSDRFGYTVVRAPRGAFLPILPPFYSTLWFGGVPYYYADDVYYLRDAARNGYVVATPPNDAPSTQAAPAAAGGDDLFTYPKNGQSSEQQATDRYECHRWAADQTGFDATQPLGGVDASQVDNKRADYRRAQVACLEARGYSVK